MLKEFYQLWILGSFKYCCNFFSGLKFLVVVIIRHVILSKIYYIRTKKSAFDFSKVLNVQHMSTKTSQELRTLSRSLNSAYQDEA